MPTEPRPTRGLQPIPRQDALLQAASRDFLKSPTCTCECGCAMHTGHARKTLCLGCNNDNHRPPCIQPRDPTIIKINIIETPKRKLRTPPFLLQRDPLYTEDEDDAQ